MATVISTQKRKRKNSLNPAVVHEQSLGSSHLNSKRLLLQTTKNEVQKQDVSSSSTSTPGFLNSGIYKELIGYLVARRKEILLDIPKQCEKLKQEIANLNKSLEASKGKRWLLNTRRDMQENLRVLQLKLTSYQNNDPIQDFDKKMFPVLRRLKKSNHKQIFTDMQEAEREFRKRATKHSDPIILQRATILDVCDECGLSMKMIENDSLFGCPKCGKTKTLSYICAPVSDSEFVSLQYAQKSRFVEWLEFCQGKEYAEPCNDILEMVMNYIFVNKISGLEPFKEIICEEYMKNGPFLNSNNALQRLGEKIPTLKTLLYSIKPNMIRTIMQSISSKNKDDRLRKCYERAPKYCSYICGYWPLRFTSSQEERLRSLYAVAIPAYEKYRKPSQPNWPGGYAYFLRCLCILLGWDVFLDHFNNATAGQKNVHEREAIREKIWKNDLDWEFVPCNIVSSPVLTLTNDNSSSKRKRNED